jgi:prepilin-type N-terminal cleavage/methylation domain-containing protein
VGEGGNPSLHGGPCRHGDSIVESLTGFREIFTVNGQNQRFGGVAPYLQKDNRGSTQENTVRHKQMGFTLVEIAIVLVIIGLLLGGVLKGQELINSAKVKNFANDFRNIPLFIYGYQDKFKALPGDDLAATTRGFGTTTNGNGNGVINGNWNTVTATDESWIFWQHARLANLASGPTSWAAAAASDPYVPKNADGGRIGIEAGNAAFIGNIAGPPAIQGLNGSYVICSDAILGKFAKQLDTTMDDGNTQTGSMRVVNGLNSTTPHTRGSGALATTAVNDSDSYTVCMGL